MPQNTWPKHCNVVFTHDTKIPKLLLYIFLVSHSSIFLIRTRVFDEKLCEFLKIFKESGADLESGKRNTSFLLYQDFFTQKETSEHNDACNKQ